MAMMVTSTNHINGIKDLTDKWIVVRQSFLKWNSWAGWIDYPLQKKDYHSTPRPTKLSNGCFMFLMNNTFSFLSLFQVNLLRRMPTWWSGSWSDDQSVLAQHCKVKVKVSWPQSFPETGCQNKSRLRSKLDKWTRNCHIDIERETHRFTF